MDAPDLPLKPKRTAMPAPGQPAAEPDLNRVMRDTLSNLIREQVVRSVGSPADLLAVHVRPLWGERYRVNIFVGKNVTSGRIANSFFLVTDSDGAILRSTPKLARLY
jgi:hypothetical protein